MKVTIPLWAPALRLAPAMIAGSMLIGASGAMSSGHTTKLITTEDAMAAMKLAGEAASSYKAATD